MSSSTSYGYERYLEEQRADAYLSLRKGLKTISPARIHDARQAVNQMTWKLNKLHLTREEYLEWKGFIDSLTHLFPQTDKADKSLIDKEFEAGLVIH